MSQAISDLIHRLLTGLVRHNDHLEFVVTGPEHDRVIDVRANWEDTPRIVGKRGAHHKAMQAILRAASERLGIRMKLNHVRQPIVGELRPMPPFQFREDWPREEIRKLILDTAEAVFGPGCGVLVLPTDDKDRFRIAVRVPDAVHKELRWEMNGHFSCLFFSIGSTNGAILTTEIMG